MNILVLGGDGFIGSHLVDYIYPLGHNITIFDRFTADVSINLEHLRGKVTFFPGEFSNREILKHALQHKDIVYHCISLTTPASSWNDPYIEIIDNLRNSVQLFELAAENGVRKIVFCSSGGTVYGRKQGLLNEKELPKPFSPYGICKLASEHFLNYFQHRSNLAFDIYRIGNPYGPRQPMKTSQGVIAVWLGNILRGDELLVCGNNETIRDYIYVEDVARLMAHSLRDLPSSDVFNISSGRGTSILELLEIFKVIIEVPFNYKIFPPRCFDNNSVILDNSKIMSHFPGFKFRELEAGIRNTWKLLFSRYE
jgi:UDP-glucose 4-epimerase